MTRVLARLMLVLGVVAMVVGLVAGVVHRQVLDGDRFASHVDTIRADPQVARGLGGLVTDRVLEQQPDLIGLRPLIESAAVSVVASPALGPVVRSAVAPLHDALSSGRDDQVVLRLADVGALLVAAVTTLSPGTEAAIPAGLDVRLAAFGGQEYSASVIDVAHRVDVLSWLMPLLGLLLLAGSALLRARDVRRVGRTVGVGLVAAAGALAALLVVGSVLAAGVDTDTLGGALLRATWAALDGSFWLAAAIAALAGGLLVVMMSPGADLSLDALARTVRASTVRRPTSLRARTGRTLVVLAVGALLLVRPLTAVTVVVSAAGVVVLASGLHDLVDLAAERMRAARGRPRPARRDLGKRVVGGVALLGLLAVLVAGAVPAGARLPSPPAQTADGGPCNGHVELCGRTYDQVAFPATHNSMSAASEPGWFLAEQPDGVMQQLDHGVRVFLIDSWPGQATQRSGVVANTAASRQAAVSEAEQTYGPTLLASALRLRDSLDLTPSGDEKAYLCHALCELGSTEWEPLMRQVRAWLDAHPREVVTFFVQDEVSPAGTAKVVEDAGLMPLVHTQRPGRAWPTLGSMIASGRRVVFLMEHTPGGTRYPWLLDGPTEVQDTPYAFTSTDQFSCALFRGRTDSPLFLVNHWLSNFSSRVTDAQTVNSQDVLLARLERCRTERGHIPNYVAVDNYDRGDLLASVDALNGFTGGGTS